MLDVVDLLGKSVERVVLDVDYLHVGSPNGKSYSYLERLWASFLLRVDRKRSTVEL